MAAAFASASAFASAFAAATFSSSWRRCFSTSSLIRACLAASSALPSASAASRTLSAAACLTAASAAIAMRSSASFHTTVGSASRSVGKIFARIAVSVTASSPSRASRRDRISPDSVIAGTTPASGPTSAPTIRGTSAPQSISCFPPPTPTTGTLDGSGVFARPFFLLLPRFFRLFVDAYGWLAPGERGGSVGPVAACGSTGWLSSIDAVRSTTPSRVSLPTSHSSIASTARHVAFGRGVGAILSRPASIARCATRSVSKTRYGESSSTSASTRWPSNIRSTPCTSVGICLPSACTRATSCSRTIAGDSAPALSRTPIRNRSASANSSSCVSGICCRRTTSWCW